ncbi:MAG: zinc ribbon domain-containing protein [Anaerolineae bacterium]|nr:zinc ribbon domain-containing protein [Anaerolineae bacterium]
MNDVLAGLGLSDDTIVLITIYGVVVLAAFWLAMIIWAYRDMRARSRDTLAQIGVAFMVAVLTVPGLLIYLFLRPRETLGEAYERSLEEEALLQEIEEKPTCPGCGQRIQENWQACPNCFTRLKKSCVHCRQMLELSWQLCPYCTTPQPAHTAEQHAGVLRQVRPASVPEEPRSVRGNNTRTAEALEFVEGDEY